MAFRKTLVEGQFLMPCCPWHAQGTRQTKKTNSDQSILPSHATSLRRGEGSGLTVGPIWPGQLHEVQVVQLLLVQVDDDGHDLPCLAAQVRLRLPEVLRF